MPPSTALLARSMDGTWAASRINSRGTLTSIALGTIAKGLPA